MLGRCIRRRRAWEGEPEAMHEQSVSRQPAASQQPAYHRTRTTPVPALLPPLVTRRHVAHMRTRPYLLPRDETRPRK